jgi:hypothetical protein
MAVRKVSHHTRIISETRTTLDLVKPGDIIQFTYRNENKDNYDKNPLVFVLLKKSKIIHGINISYLKESKVRKLLKETNFKRLRNWTTYEKAFRNYFPKKMRLIKIIEYEVPIVDRNPGEYWKQRTRNAEGFVWNAKNPQGHLPQIPFPPDEEELAIGWANGTVTDDTPDYPGEDKK